MKKSLPLDLKEALQVVIAAGGNISDILYKIESYYQVEANKGKIVPGNIRETASELAEGYRALRMMETNRGYRIRLEVKLRLPR